MPIKIVPTKGKKKKKKSSSAAPAAPMIMPGQKKMLNKMMGKSKPQTLKGGGGLKAIPEGNKGKGLSKLPTEVRNKMGFMKKGGKVMKMRGGGMASRGLNFRMR